MNQTKTNPLSAPDDTPTTPKEKPKAKKKQRRFRLFDDGSAGDYRLYLIASGDQHIPKGALLPIPDLGGFDSTASAKKFVRESGDKFANKQLMILKGIDILRCDVEVKPVVKVSFKPKSQISGEPK